MAKVTQAEIEAAAKAWWLMSHERSGQCWEDDTVDRDLFRVPVKIALEAAERVRAVAVTEVSDDIG